ncbi:MAG: ABC transporter ATP-binding protein [Nanoarchaeota archaeon]|nr:ABC transporter ATP-binding protein [Nanoarchaeota archaeon]
MPPIIVKLENISKNFGKKQILKDINLEIQKGEIYGIIGMSGSGKSTLLSLMADLLKPDKGRISYQIEPNQFWDLSEHSNKIKKLFGYSFQSPSFHSMLTVQENVEHFSTLYDLPKKFGKKNADILLKLVELDDAKNVLSKNLSGGMQKRLCFACALVHSPRILFLDEPTANLDPVLRKQTWEILKKINAQGTTIVIASQLLTELDDFCDSICIINKGKVVKEGPVGKVKKEYSEGVEIHLKSIPGNYKKIISDLRKLKTKINRLDYGEDELVVYAKKGEIALHKMIHLIEKNKEEIVYINLEQPPLKEVFSSLIGK